MATEFQMPKLGLTMEAGTIIGWHVPDGAVVEQGAPVLAIETDKVESDVEASASGRLHQTAAPGETFPCGARIGWFLAEGEEPPAAAPLRPSAAAAAPAAAVAATAVPAVAAGPPARGDRGRILSSPNARRVAAELGIDIAAVTGTGPGGRIVSEDVQSFAEALPAPALDPGPVVAATIAARRLADLLGVDIAAVPRTGADPRITREDVALYARQRLATEVPRSTSVPLLQTPSEIVPMRGMRATIAARMRESLQAMAQLTLTMDVAMDRIVADRRRRQVDGAAPGYTDYVIAAAAAALVEHPIVNSQITESGIALLPEVNVGMAVALDDGLVVPVVRSADRRSISEISDETARLAAGARARSLPVPDYEGATFTVTALGMYGVDAFTPIVYSPNTAILGVGRLRRDVDWDDDDRPVPSSVLTLSLTWDHRAFDGAPAAEFTRTVRDVLESWGER